MISSRFTITVPDFPGTGKHILCNTLTLAQVVIDDDLRAAIDALPAVPGRAETAASIAQLRKMRFLVETPEEDTAAAEAWFTGMEADTSTLLPTVLTTYSCNFACVYCLENGVKKPVFMDEETAVESARYVERKAREYDSKKIDLYFYGGEPLLNMPALRTVARRLKGFSTESGIPFSFGFNTNGSLLTRPVVEELLPLGLAWARITLDGPAGTHDRHRPLRSGKGSFALILENIRSVADLLHVDVNMNFDDGNYGELPVLMDFLAESGLKGRIGKLSFTPITTTPADREGLTPATEVDCPITSPRSVRRALELARIALEKGFDANVALATRTCAMTMRKSSFIIDPLGELYRCSGLVGRKDFCNGNFRSEGKDRYLGLQLWRRCLHCTYAPLCGDGCPFSSYLRFGDPLTLSCPKEAMEYLVQESVKLSYQKKKRKAGA